MKALIKSLAWRMNAELDTWARILQAIDLPLSHIISLPSGQPSLPARAPIL